jgi:hypothetical protein
MSRTERNFWLDVMIFVAFLVTTTTGIILWLVISHGLEFFLLGYSRSVWVAVHACFGMVGLAGIVMHIVVHRGWLKALRGRSLSRMPKKVRAYRVVDRVMWIIFIATTVFGGITWALHVGDGMVVVSLADRLHAAFGVGWIILMNVHLALHWKWIASIIQRRSPGRSLLFRW